MKEPPDLSLYSTGFECGGIPADVEMPPGAPGAEPKWTSSSKVGLGTAYHTSCKLWFTLSHGIVNELYYPRIDTPNTRDLEFLVTDGDSFCEEERRDFIHEVEYPENGVLLYRLINTSKNHGYRLIKEIYTDPYNSVLVQRTKLEIFDDRLRGKLKCFLMVSPHLNKGGWGNSGRVATFAGHRVLHAYRGTMHMMLASNPALGKSSVGYVGTSDGWQDLKNFQMDWAYPQAVDGNIAMTAEVTFDAQGEHRLAVSFGSSPQSTAAKLIQHLGVPLNKLRAAYVKQWRRVLDDEELEVHTGDWGSMFRLSRCLLLAHEDKSFSGALVASLSIPWGETKSDSELGGYHLVWPRDLVQSCMGLIAAGHTQTPRRALIWLSCLQSQDGRMPQNSWIDGLPYWKGIQLDEVVAPILLAWKLHEVGQLGEFDPTSLLRKAVKFLILHAPVSSQDRWEESSGLSPSTLAVVTAGMTAAAQMLKLKEEVALAEFVQDYADWLNRHIEDWTVTTCGDLVEGYPKHYIRLTPMQHYEPDEIPNPNTSSYWIANGGGHHQARHIVSGDFLHLVRYGLRSPLDPIIRNSLKVTDRVLKHEVLAGSCFMRYNHDGYGQKSDGSAFDGSGSGGGWPLLTGERGHYELAAGNDPFPCIFALEGFANEGGMIPEQVWWGDSIEGGFEPGQPTGSAMPLCWAHAEYLTLVKSRSIGHPFDRVEPAYQRYTLQEGEQKAVEIWHLGFRSSRVPEDSILRVVHGMAFKLQWDGKIMNSVPVMEGLHFVDLDQLERFVGESFGFEFYESDDLISRHQVLVTKKEASEETSLDLNLSNLIKSDLLESHQPHL